MTDEQAIEKMRDWLSEEAHWRKNGFGDADEKGGYRNACLMGAARLALWNDISCDGKSIRDLRSVDRISDRLEAVIREQFPDRWYDGHPVLCFNDDPETTIEDVRLVVDKTLADVRGEVA